MKKLFLFLSCLAMSHCAFSTEIPSDVDTYLKQNRNGMLLPDEQSAESLLEAQSTQESVPYGANLFAGGYESERVDGLNDNYLIAPGDKLNIWIWGAVNHAEVVTVDNQGNIFIPNVGPITVGNLAASDVNDYVSERITAVYKKNVNVYVNLLSATPVSVYITGAVMRPGQYAGMASDSVLYFLKRAGGIDNKRGSYRSIKVVRQGETIHNYDLYSFLQQGLLARSNFKDGDVVLVGPQQAAINVSGRVKYPFKFELTAGHALGDDVIELAKPYTNVSHVGVAGDRASGPFSVYLKMRDFKRFQLKDGDSITFNDDIRADVQDIQISGSYKGPSFYTVKKPTRLHDILAHIEVEPKLSNFKSVYLYRKSVAKRQKEALMQSLQRLERTVFTAPASSDGEAVIRAKEAELVMKFVEKAGNVEPLGKVILSDSEGDIANVLLEQGDVIVIPEKTDLITISGEVLMPQAVVFNQAATLEDYIAWAGGFTERADYEYIGVMRPNGLLEFNPERPLGPGDQILIMPRVDSKNMQLVKDITQILYQIAVAANVVNNFND